MLKEISIKARTPQELTEYDNFLNEVAQTTHIHPKTVKGILEPIIADVAIQNIGYSHPDNVTLGFHTAKVTVTKTDENRVMVELDF